MSVKILALLLTLSVNAMAMDRWAALAMIESGNSDHLVGQAGEISRYQILPNLWAGGNPLNAQVARSHAQAIMTVRMAKFEQIHGRPPTDFEFYVLWNAPHQVNHPHLVVRERARRFVNLVKKSASPVNNSSDRLPKPALALPSPALQYKNLAANAPQSPVALLR
jgi:hypothetical protein